MPNVDWAEPIEKVDEAAMAKVKNLYVVGWLESRTEEQIKELFAPFGTVEKVRKINNYSFVHFAQRSEVRVSIAWYTSSDVELIDTLDLSIECNWKYE